MGEPAEDLSDRALLLELLREVRELREEVRTQGPRPKKPRRRPTRSLSVEERGAVNKAVDRMLRRKFGAEKA